MTRPGEHPHRIPGPWADQAACADQPTALFFPAPGDNLTSRQAREVCARCPVKPDCSAHALRNHEPYGIWGGLSEPMRRKHRLHQKKQGAA